MAIVQIDGSMLKRMIIAGANKLEEAKQIVDELNVFPVPDGDTGTNMSLTVLAAAKEVEKTDTDDIYEVAKAAASGSLRGARGNSGVILSQLFRGFSKGLEGHKTADTMIIAAALQKGVETAYKAVMKPKEGTMLTVAREAAEKAAELAIETDDIEDAFRQMITYAHEVLQKTPDMLPVLKQAGVVDAGGRGVLYILEGAFASINSTEVFEVAAPVKTTESNFTALAAIDHENITFGYCTEFFINVSNIEDQAIQGLKGYLDTMGDSIVVVNDEEIVKIHIHTDHPGAVLEHAIQIGSLSNMKIDNMREQHETKVIQAQSRPVTEEKKEVGFIAVAMGSGLAEIFKGLGIDVVIEGGQTMNPSTEDILNAVGQVNAEKVVILPNNKNIILAAEQAAELATDKEVYVIPSKSIPQGITAMIGFEPNSSMEDNLSNMKAGIALVRTGQITYAVRDTAIEDREIKQGNILGLAEGDIQVVAEELESGTKELMDLLIDEDSELISVYYGQDITEEQANQVYDYIAEKYPECEVEVHNGGQPLYYYIFSVE